jgi:hypothetical protein
MGPTVHKPDQNPQEEIKDEETVKETTATTDVGVNSKLTICIKARISVSII